MNRAIAKTVQFIANYPVWTVVLISLLVVLPRSLWIAHVHNETFDDQYHLFRGLSVLEGNPAKVWFNDPPLGEMIGALPLRVVGCKIQGPRWGPENAEFIASMNVLYGQAWSPETLLLLVAGWKALLFVPFTAMIFYWCRTACGAKCAWLAVAFLLAEPTIAAHIPLATLDVLGMELAVTAVFCLWRYWTVPKSSRAALAGVAIAAAMLTKHTAIILPFVAFAGTFLAFVRRADESRSQWTSQKLRMQLAWATLVWFVSVWVFTGFNWAKPKNYCPILTAVYDDRWRIKSDLLNPMLERAMPAGLYVGSLFAAYDHGREGHEAFLLNKISMHGWWYYFPVVATYKVPIGVGIVFVLGLCLIRPRMFDSSMTLWAISFAAWSAFLLSSTINIGWRHFLIPYVFAICIVCRPMAQTSWGLTIAYLGVVLTIVHSAFFYPNPLAYLNRPVDKPWLYISDSNLDWGQSTKVVGRWIETERSAGRLSGPVAVYPQLHWIAYTQAHNLPSCVNIRLFQQPAILTGTVIISPVFLSGQYDNTYAFLRNREPDAIIDSCMAVYYLSSTDQPPTLDKH